MSYDLRLLVCLAVSAAVHMLFVRGARLLPERPQAVPPSIVQVQVTPPSTPPAEPEPEPEPEPAKPPPEPPKTTPPPQPLEPRRHSSVHAQQQAMTARESPPTERPSDTGAPGTGPVFGVSMESTSEAGTGPSVPLGNTLQVKPDKTGPAAPEAVKPLPPPVEAYEVTKIPIPQGRCSGHYTDEARQAGIEGTVVLDLVVGEDGTPRDIKVVQGLEHGLTEAALTALKGCRFTPGERQGKPVAVRVRGFKIRFFLQDQ